MITELWIGDHFGKMGLVFNKRPVFERNAAVCWEANPANQE